MTGIVSTEHEVLPPERVTVWVENEKKVMVEMGKPLWGLSEGQPTALVVVVETSPPLLKEDALAPPFPLAETSGLPEPDALTETEAEADGLDPALGILALAGMTLLEAGMTSVGQISSFSLYPRLKEIRTSAVGQLVNVVDTEDGNSDVGTSKCIVPCSLTETSIGERLESATGTWVQGQVNIRGELVDGRVRVGVKSVDVEVDVPDTRSVVLGRIGHRGVYEELVGGGVGTNESSQVIGRDGLVRKQIDQSISVRERRWQETGRR